MVEKLLFTPIEAAQALGIAADVIEQLRQIAMRLDHRRIAFERAIEAANCRVVLAHLAVD